MSKRFKIKRPPESAGFLYVIGFDTGVIKAGRTSDLDRRTGEHRRAAARFDVSAVPVWTSEYIQDSDEGERMLLGRLGTIGQRTNAGREYFRGVPFAVARHQAEIVASYCKVRPASCTCCEGSQTMRLAAVVVAGPASPEPDDFSATFTLADGCQIEAQLNDPDLGPTGRYPLRPGDRLDIDLQRRGRTSWDVWGTYPMLATR
ncbi:GIY-YIG nuclease family protein [Actinoplanes sp. NPDC089786]|uniref:GIY-YIG nuclease family protein n=1 Tax=Actinoplanes sp. NPDC089786 TaxID=3155185 RepID=UPI00343BD68C